ncbi:uncharacterized protein DEA37_0014204 [Paragonimus westermani]|uniref:Uncharacterized protein n=1 Tax=Paragonimus westermani TaxID=34504 RepID=A0A5J4NMD2_9TREM|nr:uncharacterized protein DEA37_0014204 [Paragonimus westermani]
MYPSDPWDSISEEELTKLPRRLGELELPREWFTNSNSCFQKEPGVYVTTTDISLVSVAPKLPTGFILRQLTRPRESSTHLNLALYDQTRRNLPLGLRRTYQHIEHHLDVLKITAHFHSRHPATWRPQVHAQASQTGHDYRSWCDLRRLEATVGNDTRFLTSTADDSRWEQFRHQQNRILMLKEQTVPEASDPMAEKASNYLTKWQLMGWRGPVEAPPIYWQSIDSMKLW